MWVFTAQTFGVNGMPGYGSVMGSPAREAGMSAPCDRLIGRPSHAAIIGLGRSGLACARFLSRCGLAIDVYDTAPDDSRVSRLLADVPGARLFRDSLTVRDWCADSLLVLSPGVPLSHPDLASLLRRGVRPVGDVELFAQCVRAPVVAITGSNGKTTVTALTGHILAAAGRAVRVGGNIGTPVLELLDDAADVYVLELSSFQLETTWSLTPAAATVLNLVPDHMDRYTKFDDYLAAKARIFNGDGLMVLNADDPSTPRLARDGRRGILFGSGVPAGPGDYGLAEQADGLWLRRGTTPLMPASEVRLPGRHNLLNVLAAWALAADAGVVDATIRTAVGSFTGLPHRTQWLRRWHDIDWINDSKGTNVGATVAAVQGLETPLVLIAGGLGKGADFTPLRAAVAGKARAVVLIGRDAPQIEAAVADVVTCHHAGSMQAAVQLAARLARAGDSVLLSPACASFDMFDGYEHRGAVFRRCVEELA